MTEQMREMIAGNDSPYYAERVFKGVGDMSNEQAVAHWQQVKALLNKAAHVGISGTDVSVTLEGALEVSTGGRTIYFQPEDMELLMEQCMVAMQARDSFTPDASDSMRTTPASTDTSNMNAGGMHSSTTGVMPVPAKARDNGQAHMFKVMAQVHEGRVQAAKEAAKPYVTRQGFGSW